MPTSCPSEAELKSILQADGTEAARQSIAAHLGECATCRERLNALAIGDDDRLRNPAGLAKSTPAIPQSLVEDIKQQLPTMKIDAGAALTLPAGTQIGRYKVLEQVGEGGFGVVYIAEQSEPVRRRVALKIIK